jgi:hypothetical protein
MNLQVIAIVITVVGWPLTAFIAYRFGQHSQKLQREHAAKSAIQDRKREFLAFMQAWRVEVDRRYLESGGFARNPSAYADVVSEFRAAAEMIRKDFTRDSRTKFEQLVSTVSSCRAIDHKKVVQAIDELVAHVDAA